MSTLLLNTVTAGPVVSTGPCPFRSTASSPPRVNANTTMPGEPTVRGQRQTQPALRLVETTK